jgi:hypothetical protein
VQWPSGSQYFVLAPSLPIEPPPLRPYSSRIITVVSNGSPKLVGKKSQIQPSVAGGLAITSILAIFPSRTVQEITLRSRPRGGTMIPMDPLTRAGPRKRVTSVRVDTSLLTALALQSSIRSPCCGLGIRSFDKPLPITFKPDQGTTTIVIPHIFVSWSALTATGNGIRPGCGWGEYDFSCPAWFNWGINVRLAHTKIRGEHL